MTNKKLFKTGKTASPTDTFNEAGGNAYSLSQDHILAQFAVTGCFNDTYYTDASAQLETIKAVARQCSNQVIAKTAIYARKTGHMKDMPAFLLTLLLDRDKELFAKTFPLVCDNAKQLRNFAQFILSKNVSNVKSLQAYAVRKQLQKWFDAKSAIDLLVASIGKDPSLADIIRLSHVRPGNNDAMFKYILGYPVQGNEKYAAYFDELPQVVRDYENFKANGGSMPKVPFELLEGLNPGKAGWTEIAKNATWTQLRNKLNILKRNGVFDDAEMVDYVAKRLADADEVRKSRTFPYQLLVAYLAATDVPVKVQNALQDALEVSLENVPVINGQIYIAIDVSGSMSSPVTGYRGSVTGSARCVDVAALFAAALLRQNPEAEVIPFNSSPLKFNLNGRDSVMTNTKSLAGLLGGGTDCSSVLAALNQRQAKGNVVIYLSDNQSWIDRGHGGTRTMHEWQNFKSRNKTAKLVCIDFTPYTTSQADGSRKDVLQVAGFNDSVFSVLAQYLNGPWVAEHWLNVIQGVEI